MKFMVIVKADKRTEAGVLPEPKDIEVMGKFNQELMKLLDKYGSPFTKRAKGRAKSRRAKPRAKRKR